MKGQYIIFKMDEQKHSIECNAKVSFGLKAAFQLLHYIRKSAEQPIGVILDNLKEQFELFDGQKQTLDDAKKILGLEE